MIITDRRRSVYWPKVVEKFTLTSRVLTTDVSAPKCDGMVEVYPEKIQRIVTDISQLTLLEASQLNELLKVLGDLCLTRQVCFTRYFSSPVDYP